MTTNSHPFKRIFVIETVIISIKISLKFVPEVSISNMPVLVQKMAWCRPGDKPFSEPMMVRLFDIITRFQHYQNECLLKAGF